MSWEKLRELFEAEYVSGLREDTRDNYADSFDAFERLAKPAQVLQKLMRHANIRVTMEYHANVDDATVQAIQSRPRGHINKYECERNKLRNSAPCFAS